MKYVVPAFLTFILQGCSSTGVTISKPDTLIENPQGIGYLSGDLASSRIWPFTADNIATTLNFRHTASKHIFSITSTQSGIDYSSEEIRGQLFSVPLPAGNYELYSVSFKSNNGVRALYSSSELELGVNFTVEPNEVTFLGQFVTSSLVAKSTLWNTQYPSGLGQLDYHQATVQDQEAFSNRFPEQAALDFNPQHLKGLQAPIKSVTIIE